MLSNFCVVFVITWNLSAGRGASGPGAAAVELQDESAPASMNAIAAATTHVPRTRLIRWSPRALCFDLDGDLAAGPTRWPPGRRSGESLGLRVGHRLPVRIVAAVHHALEHHFVRQARDQLGRPRRLCNDLPNFGDADIEVTGRFCLRGRPKQLAGLDVGAGASDG